MFCTLSTFFGPLVVINTDIRITPEIEQLGHWEFNDLIDILRIYEKFYADRTGTMLDVGCNIGSWLLPISQRYTRNKVLAIDCQPLVLDCVSQTIKLNHLNNVQTKCCAVSNVCVKKIYKKVDYQWGANFGAYEFEPPYAESDFNGRVLADTDTMSIETIDSFQLTDVTFIKLDVEGMEYQALAGAANTIKQCQPFVAFEHHKTNKSAALELLKTLDYMIYSSVGQMTLAIPKSLATC